jgi:hypothetical protein
VTPEARTAIKRAYLDGASIDEIACAAGVAADRAETYLRWWCDRGCPGAEKDSEGNYRLAGKGEQ